MTRSLWPATLEECLAEPSVQVCPGCVFNRTCPAHTQKGMVDDVKEPKVDCWYYGRLKKLVWGEFAIAVPETAEELRELTAERIGMKEEG